MKLVISNMVFVAPCAEHFVFIPSATKLRGVYWNHHVRLSLRLSVRLSGRIWVSGA